MMPTIEDAKDKDIDMASWSMDQRVVSLSKLASQSDRTQTIACPQNNARAHAKVIQTSVWPTKVFTGRKIL